MHTLNEEVNHNLAKVKSAFRESLMSERIKQEAVASRLEVNQSTIQRWTDPESEIDIPVGALPPMRNDERLRPVAEAVLASIGARFVSFGNFKGLDGSIDDELLMEMELSGALAATRKKDKKRALQIARRIRENAERMEVELMREDKEATQ